MIEIVFKYESNWGCFYILYSILFSFDSTIYCVNIFAIKNIVIRKYLK